MTKDDLGYHFSSAKFYTQDAVQETGIDEFGFLKIYLGYLTVIKANGL